MRSDTDRFRAGFVALLLMSSFGLGAGFLAGLAYGIADAVGRGHPGFVPLAVVLGCGLGLAAGFIAGVLTSIMVGLLPGTVPSSGRYAIVAGIALVTSLCWQVVCFQRNPLGDPILTLAVAIGAFIAIVLAGRIVRFFGSASR